MSRCLVLSLLPALLMLGGRPNAACGQAFAAVGTYAGYDLDYDSVLAGATVRFRAEELPFVGSANLEYMPQASQEAEDPGARIVQLDLNGLLPLIPNGPLSVWGGGGPALQYVRTETKRDESGNIVVESGADLRFGFNGTGEARLQVAGPLHAFAKLDLTLGTPMRTRLGGGVLVTIN